MMNSSPSLGDIYGTIADFQKGFVGQKGNMMVFTGKIKEIGPIKEYEHGGSRRRMRHITVFDDVSHILIKVHNPKLLEDVFRIGRTYAFSDVLMGDTKTIGILTYRSKAHMVKNMNTEEGKEQSVPPIELLVKGQKRSIVSVSDALASPKKAKVSIEGKVLKVEPVIERHIKEELVPICNLKLVGQDKSKVKVGLFRQLAKVGESLTPGANIRITNVMVGSFGGKPVLSSGDGTTIEALPDTTIQFEAGLAEISDSDGEGTISRDFVIQGIASVTVYRTCFSSACGRKALDKYIGSENTLRCRNCGNKYPNDTAVAAGLVVKVLLQGIDVEVRIFTDDCLTLLRMNEVFEWNDQVKSQVEDKLSDLLPLRCEGTLRSTDILNVHRLV